MATTAVIADVKPNEFKRFIDEIGAVFTRTAPKVIEVAQALEPLLALSPIGPEYDLVVNAIVGIAKVGAASAAAGTVIAGPAKMSMVVQAVTPALTKILGDKGVMSGVDAAIAQFAQSVYEFQTGPTAKPRPTFGTGLLI